MIQSSEQISDSQSSSIELKRAISDVGAELGQSLNTLLNTRELASIRPSEVARRLGVSQTVMSRIVRATQSADPLVCVYRLPGPQPLRKMLRTADRSGIDKAVLKRAESSVDEFERLINTIANDRNSFDTLIGGWLPEAREKVDFQSRQAVFRGMSQLKGMCRESTIVLRFLLPVQDGKVSTITVVVALGLRRLRPGAQVIGAVVPPDDCDSQLLQISGKPVDSNLDYCIDEFSSFPRTFIETEMGTIKMFMLDGDKSGIQSSSDFVWGTHEITDFGDGGENIKSMIGVPVKNWYFYTFVHKDWPSQEPPLYQFHDTSNHGFVDQDSSIWDLTAYGPPEKMRMLEGSMLSLRCPTMPRFSDLVRHVCDQSGIDPDEYTNYGIEQEFPLYGSGVFVSYGDPK